MLHHRLAPFVLTAFLLCSCSRESDSPPKAPSALPAVAKSPSATAVNATSHGRYRMYHLLGASSLQALSKELGTERMLILLKLNRRDLAHLKSGDSVVVPETADSILGYSPFPLQLEGADSVPKLIMVSRRVQAIAAYEQGKLVRWGPTSTGKRSTPTPEGLYHTNWKSKETHSTVDESWVMKWYFNLDNMEGISMHEYELPGYPASHSCVRLLSEDAKWFYDWADQWKLSPHRDSITAQGTPVVVFGTYSYGKTPPWKKLAANEHVTDVSADELKKALDTYFFRSSTPRPSSASQNAPSTKEHDDAKH